MTTTVSAEFVKQQAAEVGFQACGIAPAAPLHSEEFPLRQWLAAGYHADMDYMQQHVDMRYDPRQLVEGARSVVSLLLAYKPDRRTEGNLRIAQYAYGDDYHQRLKGMLFQLMDRLTQRYPDFQGRPFVDTAPISDRHWAVRAGLGWIGNNTLLLNPHYGSYCFIGEIVTTSAVDRYDEPVAGSCGNCRRCVQACPNGAIVFNVESHCFMVDARSCSSYNTIENRDDRLPENVDTKGYIFGCDICQLACPFNETAPSSFSLSDDRKEAIEHLPFADETAFRHFAKHSPLNRIKYPQWQRNIAHASKNR